MTSARIGPQLRRVERDLDHILRVNLAASPPAGRSRRALTIAGITGSLAVVGVTAAVLNRVEPPSVSSERAAEPPADRLVASAPSASESPPVAVAAAAPAASAPTTIMAPKPAPARRFGERRVIAPINDRGPPSTVVATREIPAQAGTSERTPPPMAATPTTLQTATASMAVATPVSSPASAQPSLPGTQDRAATGDAAVRDGIDRRERERAIDALRQLRAR